MINQLQWREKRVKKNIEQKVALVLGPCCTQIQKQTNKQQAMYLSASPLRQENISALIEHRVVHCRIVSVIYALHIAKRRVNTRNLKINAVDSQ